MIAEAVSNKKTSPAIRRLDLTRDLPGLADLIEISFQAELSLTDNSIASEFRQLAKAGPLLWLLQAVIPIRRHLDGFVWVEDGRVIGNVSLSRESRQNAMWTINNVAVHPDFRGRGIAQQLMKVAMANAALKSARRIWLEVQCDNEPAKALYQGLGFVVADTVQELSRPAGAAPSQPAAAHPCFRSRRHSDAMGLYRLVRETTPPTLLSARPLDLSHFRLPLSRKVARWLEPVCGLVRRIDQVLDEAGTIHAWLKVTGQYDGARHRMAIIVHPDCRGTLECEMVSLGLTILSAFPARQIVATVSDSHPAALEAFRRAGFVTLRRLDQMVLDLDCRPDGAKATVNTT